MKSQGQRPQRQRKIYITRNRLIRRLDLGEPTDVAVKCVIDGMDVGGMFAKWATNHCKQRTWDTAGEFADAMKKQAPDMFGNDDDWKEFQGVLEHRKAAREASAKLTNNADEAAAKAALAKKAA